MTPSYFFPHIPETVENGVSPEKPLKFIMPYIQNRNIQKIILSFYDFILELSERKYKTS